MRLVISSRKAACYAVVAVCLVRTAAAVSEGLTIPSFSADITVNPDSTLTVQEEFTTRVPYLAFYGDIRRDLPVSANDRWDTRYARPSSKVRATLQHVYRDDLPLPATITSRDGLAEIRLGQIPHGDHRYRILYTVSGVIRIAGWRGTTDLLYWNALGHAWPYPVDAASVAVHMPVSVSAKPSPPTRIPACEGGRTIRPAVI